MHLFQEYYRHFFQYMILITAGDDILPDSAEITLIQGDIYWVFKMQKKPNILQCFTRILCPYCLYLISSLELRAGSPAFCHCSCMWSPGTSLCNSALQEGLLMNSVLTGFSTMPYLESHTLRVLYLLYIYLCLLEF